MLGRLDAYLQELNAHHIGVHLDGIPAREGVLIACRAAGKTVVSLEERPAVVITADGAVDNGVVRSLKDEVDDAVPDAERVIVIRNVGRGALAPTLDAYLDVEMVPGRDVWLDDL